MSALTAPRRIERIVSGGQTGADRGALDAAIALGIAHGGWCPKGRRAEDGEIPARYRLDQTPTRDYRVRTRRNVDLADATVVFARGALAGGSRLTVEIARRRGKPVLILDLADLRAVRADAVEELRAWIVRNEVRTLNVAGPRQSEAPGLHEEVRSFLEEALDR